VLLPLALLQVAGRCGGGSGSGGQSVREIKSPDVRCAALGDEFPPGFGFVPGTPGHVWVADFAPPSFVPLDVSSVPPQVPAAPSPFLLPPDSDGDGIAEGSFQLPLSPILDGIAVVAPDLAFATASSYEEVILIDAQRGGLRTFEVAVDASFARADNPQLPIPGTSALRTALSTFACVRPPAGALDSRGDPVATSVPQRGFCDPAEPSYLASFTSGAAVAGGHLFVSTSNLGNGAGTSNPQFLPGSVLVYDLDLAATPPRVAPNPDVPVIVTTAFNPTHVTAVSAAGRDFVLVSVSGAIGISEDQSGTPEIESAGIALTDAAIDVIDAHTLELVATVPLGRAGLAFGRLAIDASGRVAVAGSAVARWLLAMDLSVLAGLPASAAQPLVLDGSSGPDAVVFDAAAPFQIPARPDGAPAASCPGFTAGVAFAHTGSRIHASDYCDGTLATIDVDLAGSPPAPLAAARFDFVRLASVTAALRSDTLGRPRGPSALEPRPGIPGVDFSGPELFLLVSQPGLLCGIDLE
jgi:hypothetical protein